MTIPTSASSAPALKPLSKPLPVRLLRSTLSFAIDQWFLLLMGLLILLAYFFPIVGRRGGSIRSEYTINYGAVAVIFLVSGLSLPFNKLLKHAKNIRLHLIVQTYSFLFTSSVFFGVAVAASTNRYIETSALIGLIAVGCLPTTIASNVTMTREAGGDVAATMVSVTLGNLLGPFISPLLIARLYLPAVPAFAEWIPSEAVGNLSPLYRNVMMQMGLSVYLPLVVGQVVRAIWTETVQKTVTKFKLAKVGSCMLLLLVWSTFSNAFSSGSLEILNTPTIVFIIFINLVLCIGFTVLTFFTVRPPKALNRWNPIVFARVTKEEVISYCFCCPAKTQALGIPLLASMYTSSSDRTRSLIQIPVILYTVEQIFVGQFMIWYFKRWLAKDKAKAAAHASKAEEGNTSVSVETKEDEGRFGGELGAGDKAGSVRDEEEREKKGGIGGNDGTAGMVGTGNEEGIVGGGDGRGTGSKFIERI